MTAEATIQHFRFQRRRRPRPRRQPMLDSTAPANSAPDQPQIWPPIIEGSRDLTSGLHYSHSLHSPNDVDCGIQMRRRLALNTEEQEWHRQRILLSRWAYPFSTRMIKCFIMSVVFISYLAQTDGFNLPESYFYSHLHLHHPGSSCPAIISPLALFSAPAKNLDSFDAIEEEIIREQTSHPNNKSLRTGAKKGQKAKRIIRPTLPTEPTAKKTSSSRKKKRHNPKPKSFESETEKMPPWLAQYENDDLVGSYYLPEESSFVHQSKSNNENKQQTEMQRLQLAMNGIFYHPPTNKDNEIHTTINTARIASNIPEEIPYFTPSEIHEVMDSIRVASHSNSNLMAGCADFIYLMLTLEEEGVLTSDFLSRDPWDDDDDDDIGTQDDDPLYNDDGRGRPEPHSIMTRDVLVAAAFHYCDCVRARKAGVYDYARQAMEASLDMRMWKELEQKKLWLPPAEEATRDTTLSTGDLEILEDVVNSSSRQHNTNSVDGEIKSIAASTNVVTRQGLPIEHYGEESLQIAAGAARLKRAEIMSSIVKSGGSQTSRGNASQPIGDAKILRSFLVSLSEDWRALVIRSSACLYRLKGIVEEQEYALDSDSGDGPSMKSSRSVMLSTTSINTARDAFRVYAPLAQQLGMQRLKTELENAAFRILYPRQYSVVSSLYNGDIDEMKTIVQVLSSRIEQLLRSDPVFIGLCQVNDVSVSSRVKEPYSLWKKLLRYRKEAADAKNMDNKFGPATLSLKWVPDAIAFRVVINASRLSHLEDDESLRTREKMLCYYALQLISDVWPASTRNEAKDYIKNPKPNGYQSLHYTASLMVAGEEWPFEVQIRSEEMHRIAEFGVAAHWDYKLQNKVMKALPGNTLSQGDTPLLALPPASNSTGVLAETQQLTVEVNSTSTRDAPKGRIASYVEALTTSRETIVQNNRFIFLSSTKNALDGKIVSIDPSASNIAEVLEKLGAPIDDDIPDDLEIYQNGVSTSLDEELSNGDILTLPSFLIDKLRV